MSSGPAPSLIVLLALCGAGVALVVVHEIAWRILSAVKTTAMRLMGPVAASRAFIRSHPITAWFAFRFPRLYAFIAARLRPRPFTGLPLTLIVCAALYLVSLFAGLVDELREADEVVAFDEFVSRVLDDLRVQPALDLFLWITELGGGPTAAAVALVATAFLWTEGRLRFIPALWITLLGSQLTTWTGKYLVGRDRPQFLDVTSAVAPSFPSGHATAAMAIYGFLAYVIVRRLSSTRLRFEIVYWTSILIALVGFSRIYLRVHFASDVLSGFIVGGFWLLVGVAVAEWPGSRPARKAS